MAIPGAQQNPQQPNPYQSNPYTSPPESNPYQQPGGSGQAGASAVAGAEPARATTGQQGAVDAHGNGGWGQGAFGGQPPVVGNQTPGFGAGPPAGPGAPAAPGGPLAWAGPAAQGGFGAAGGGGGRGGGWGWLWGGIVGAVFVALVGTLALSATGTFGDDEPQADLAGYHFYRNVCDAADLDAFGDHYDLDDSLSEDEHYNSRQRPLDVSYCTQSLRATETSESAQVSTSVEWHKETDPEAEFGARQRAYDDHESSVFDYRVKPVRGVGEEAYLITGRTTEPSGLSSVTLTVRDGWLTYEMTWSQPGATEGEGPSESDVSDWLEQDTKSALANLKKPESSGGSQDDEPDPDGDEGTEPDEPEDVPDPPEEDPGEAPGLDEV